MMWLAPGTQENVCVELYGVPSTVNARPAGFVWTVTWTLPAGVGVAVALGVGVAVAVGVAIGVAVGVGVGVAVGVGVGVGVAVAVAVGVGVGVGVEGGYSSALAKELTPPEDAPPAARTWPFGSKVAVC